LSFFYSSVLVWTAFPSSDYYALSATSPGIGISYGVAPFLLPIFLTILGEASRVRCVGLMQDAVGGVFSACPITALCGFPVPIQGKQVDLYHLPHISYWNVRRSLCSAFSAGFELDWLTCEARYVRVGLSRRAMHASGDSPWRPSAKQHVLEACFLLMPSFRSMLLTL